MALDAPPPVKTRVFTAIDYTKEGKQTGILRVPQVRDDSGWGVIQIPICVIRNGAGPTLLLTGCTHGDEYEAPLAMMDLARELEPKDLKGLNVIIDSGCAISCAKAGRRTVSGRRARIVNRSLPRTRSEGTFQHGDHRTTSPKCLCRARMRTACSVFGGLGMDFVPSTTSHVLDTKAKQAETERLGMAFGAPYHVVIHEVDASYTFMSTCERKGVTAISSELGGIARVSIPGVECAAKGLRNALIHYGMMKGKVPDSPTRRVVVPNHDAYCFAPEGGVYRPFHALGATIEKGQPVGAIYSFDQPFRDPGAW